MLEKLRPILDHLGTVDLADAAAARESLQRAFPPDSALVRELRALFQQGVEDGSLCTQQAPGARFSRVAKSSPETHGYSVDAVRLSGPGMWHRHTTGEVDLCFARSESARFDGHPEGWVVFGPGSDHVPTVTGGEMDILYFLPGGALQWKRE
jgi:hypothetical protein